MRRRLIRPGPTAIAPGQCPGGVVIHVYAVPSGLLVTTAAIRPDDDVAAHAERDAMVHHAFHSGPACLVAYDGDSGERFTPEAWSGYAWR